MTDLLRYIGTLFDTLDDKTSDETAKHGIYGGTRPEEGVYAISNTQSRKSTYAAGPSEGTSRLAPEREPFDCVDPRACPTCQPTPADD